MHRSVMEWIGTQVLNLALRDKSVLEVGSLNVNGSVRRFFKGPYVGIDMQGGPGVDLVLDAHDLDVHFLDYERFDVVVCTEMLEHDSAPWVTVAQMRQMVAPDGWLLLTCRGYDERGCFPVHEYPADLWRFSVPGVAHLLKAGGWHPDVVRTDPEAPGVFARGRAT